MVPSQQPSEHNPTASISVPQQIQSVQESAHHQSQQSSSSSTLDDKTVHMLINGLQQASKTNVTSFPIRDVPPSTVQMTTDPFQQPNYIPSAPESKQSYINSENERAYIESSYGTSSIKQPTIQHEEDDQLSWAFSEFGAPLVIVVLYVLFQSPIVKQAVMQAIPLLSNTDMNFNIYGTVCMGSLIACAYYLIIKFVLPRIQ